jgi:coproporphyrinogen III oxidase-like Fe-S oxidoreductase
MYKTLRFQLRTVDEISADLSMLRTLWPQARSVFLGDSDSLVHPRLLDIVTQVREIFPEVERITSYARLSTLRRKPIEALRALNEAGLTRVHAGLESGSARILKRVNKGPTPAQAIRGGLQAIEAGFNLCLYVLSGLGGEDDWEEHARETAKVVNAVRPHFLRLRSLALLPGTPLREEWEAGTFHPALPLTRLRETRLLTQLLVEPGATTVPREIEISSDHFSNYVWAGRELVYGGINGFLPSDGSLMLETLDQAIRAVQAGDRATDVGTLALHGKVPNL